MSVELVAALTAAAPAAPLSSPALPAPAAAGFGEMFSQGLGQVNASILQADHEVRMLASGQAGNLHEVMMHLEEARLSLQLMAQVRNRLLDAYQEVMRTQV